MSRAIENLSKNLIKFIKCNTDQKKYFDEFCKSNKITLESFVSMDTLLAQETRMLAFDFCDRFSLDFDDLLIETYNPIRINKFRKNNNQVDIKVINNLRQLALISKLDNKPNNFKKLPFNDDKLLNFFYNKIYKSFEVDFIKTINEYSKEKDLKINIGKLFNNFTKKIYKELHCKILFINNNYGIEGVYFNKPVATAFIYIRHQNYARVLFTILHELYHFFKDMGDQGNEFSICDSSDLKNSIKKEDMQANRFASNLLFYNKSEELQSLNPLDFIKKYPISKQTYKFHTKRNVKGEYQQKAFINEDKPSKKKIQILNDNGEISNRVRDDLLYTLDKCKK